MLLSPANVPAGFGLVDTAHAVPLYRSTSVFCAVAVRKSPTAKQLVRLGQATLLKWLSVAPTPVGLVMIAQLVPFHFSTSVFDALPSADHAAGAMAATPAR